MKSMHKLAVGGRRIWSKTKRGPGRSPKDSRHNRYKRRLAKTARRRGLIQ